MLSDILNQNLECHILVKYIENIGNVIIRIHLYNCLSINTFNIIYRLLVINNNGIRLLLLLLLYDYLSNNNTKINNFIKNII